MNLARASVRRPVFTTMVTLIVVVLGVVALSRLQIDLLPSIELPTLTVRTKYEGADPIVMERLVTQIVEEIVATVPGVVEMTSQSYDGNSSVRVSFGWGSSVDTAAVDVQATLEDEISELPDEIVGPRITKFDVDSFPVVLLGISSRLDPVELTQFVEDQIRYRFARIPGVAQVDPWGGFTREVRVELDPAKVNALGLPLNDILESIRDANLDLPAGKIERGRFEVTLRAPAEFTGLDEIRNTVISERDGAMVTLRQVAKVKDTYEKLTRIIRVNGERGLRVAIRKQAEANTVEVSRRVLEEVDEINRTFPQIRIVPVINQGNFIERSIANVARSVLYGGSLAVLVLLFFLRNLRSTVVISLAIPISVVATFALLYFGGFTLNLMTLGGLALGVGMMVDSSVVVLENVYRRHRERGEKPGTAAVAGTREVATAVTAGTVTTLAIFLPLVFVRGVPGVTDVDVSREAGIPQQQIHVLRDKIADLGLNVRDVTEIIETAVAGSKAGEFRAAGNSYRILVQLENAEKRSIDEILDLTLHTPAGEQVALRNLVTTETGRGPVIIERKDHQRLVSVTANVADRDLGSVAADVRARLEGIPRPIGYDLNIAGNYEEQEKAFRELALSLLLALVLVYMVLASQYESLRDPLVVMLSVPVAAVGVLLTLFFTDTTLNLQSAIGCIMLCGIAVNNAILLVDQTGRLRREGMATHEALSEAGRRRLRPILMTTLTTILALLPLAFGIGEGADAQAPLARAVVGGLAASTVITLVLIPAVYSLFYRNAPA